MTQPTRPRIGPQSPQRRYILDALDQEARAIAAGTRAAQRLIDRRDATRRRSMRSVGLSHIPPRWYQEIVRARARR